MAPPTQRATREDCEPRLNQLMSHYDEEDPLVTAQLDIVKQNLASLIDEGKTLSEHHIGRRARNTYTKLLRKPKSSFPADKRLDALAVAIFAPKSQLMTQWLELCKKSPSLSPYHLDWKKRPANKARFNHTIPDSLDASADKATPAGNRQPPAAIDDIDWPMAHTPPAPGTPEPQFNNLPNYAPRSAFADNTAPAAIHNGTPAPIDDNTLATDDQQPTLSTNQPPPEITDTSTALQAAFNATLSATQTLSILQANYLQAPNGVHNHQSRMTMRHIVINLRHAYAAACSLTQDIDPLWSLDGTSE